MVAPALRIATLSMAFWALCAPASVMAGPPPVDQPLVVDDGSMRRVIVPEMQPIIEKMLPTGGTGVLPDGAVIETVALKASRIEIGVRLGDKTKVLFALSPRNGRPGEGDPVHFELRAQEVPPTLPAARRAVLESALNQLVIAGEAGFAWREVRANVTLSRPDPKLQAALAQAHTLLAGDDKAAASTAASDVALHWPAQSASLFSAWDIGVLQLEAGHKDAAAPYFDRILERFGEAVAVSKLPAAVWSRAAAANRFRRGAAAGDELLARCPEQATDGDKGCKPWELARIAELQGDDAAAQAYMDKVLGDGREATLADLTGRIALAMRRGDSASELRWTRIAAERFADQPEALQLYGGALFRKREFEAAVRVYERLFALAPKRPGVLGHLSGAFNRLGGEVRTGKRPGERYYALVDEMAARAAEGDPLARFLQSVDLFYGGEFAEAAERFAALEEPLGHEARVFIYGAMAHHWLGNDAQAEKLSARAIEVGPNDPDVYYCRSHMVRRRDKAAAVADLKRYIALAEGPGAIRFDDKTDRIRNEIEMLEKGELPPDWDRPGGPGGGRNTRLALAGLAGLLLAGAAIWFIRRRRRAG